MNLKIVRYIIYVSFVLFTRNHKEYNVDKKIKFIKYQRSSLAETSPLNNSVINRLLLDQVSIGIKWDNPVATLTKLNV